MPKKITHSNHFLEEREKCHKNLEGKSKKKTVAPAPVILESNVYIRFGYEVVYTLVYISVRFHKFLIASPSEKMRSYFSFFFFNQLP